MLRDKTPFIGTLTRTARNLTIVAVMLAGIVAVGIRGDHDAIAQEKSPAVLKGRESARRSQATTSLKQIGLAFYNYHEVHGKLPARASFDANGKSLLSWRVHILPFIDESELYKIFKLNEPWDSEHNKKLISQMPMMYANPNFEKNKYKTNFLLPVGKGTLFEKKQGAHMSDIIDGTANTVIAMEADKDQSVIWTKPDDLNYNPEKPRNGLGKLRQGSFNVLFADGSVRIVSQSINEETLKSMLTSDGGETHNF